jgi:hypothetical protein
MTDLAPAIYDRRTQPRDDGDYLLLPAGGATPKTVYVKRLLVENGNSKAGFALEPTSQTWNIDGICWEFKSDDIPYGMFINFVLLEGVLELLKMPLLGAPDFWFSEDWIPSFGGLKNQLSCCPIVAKTTTTYTFRVLLPDGPYDPKIIVTPFPGI